MKKGEKKTNKQETFFEAEWFGRGPDTDRADPVFSACQPWWCDGCAQ